MSESPPPGQRAKKSRSTALGLGRPITVRRNPSGTKSTKWCVDGLRSVQGKRMRRFFPTRELAEDFARDMRDLYEKEGYEGANLSHAERASAISCIRRLARHGATLEDATNFFLRGTVNIDTTQTVAGAAAEFLKKKKDDGCKPRYLADLTGTLRKLKKAFGAKTVSSMTKAALEEWLRGLPVSAVARNNHQRALSVFFAHCDGRYISGNPCSKLTPASVTKSPTTVFSVAEVTALLRAAEEVNPSIIPYIAIAAFAGPRTSELNALKWEAVNLDTGTIEISAAIAKNRAERYIPIQPNLAAWLASHKQSTGSVRPTNARRILAAIREVAGIYDEKQGKNTPLKNRFRHSFGSYRLATIKSESAVALEMGNSPGVIMKHYRLPILPAEATKYFNIMPSNLASQ